MTALIVDIRTRDGEACQPQPQLLWDTVWNPATQQTDWAIASSSETSNRGGLQATSAIATAVILSIFTDRRCPADHPLSVYAVGDIRGYPGDALDVRADLGEDELGSLLWLLERSVKTADTKRYAQVILQDCLAWLVTQGVAAKVTVDIADVSLRGLGFAIGVYARSGEKLYAQQFSVLWNEVGA